MEKKAIAGIVVGEEKFDNNTLVIEITGGGDRIILSFAEKRYYANSISISRDREPIFSGAFYTGSIPSPYYDLSIYGIDGDLGMISQLIREVIIMGQLSITKFRNVTAFVEDYPEGNDVDAKYTNLKLRGYIE